MLPNCRRRGCALVVRDATEAQNALRRSLDVPALAADRVHIFEQLLLDEYGASAGAARRA